MEDFKDYAALWMRTKGRYVQVAVRGLTCIVAWYSFPYFPTYIISIHEILVTLAGPPPPPPSLPTPPPPAGEAQWGAAAIVSLKH